MIFPCIFIKNKINKKVSQFNLTISPADKPIIKYLSVIKDLVNILKCDRDVFL